MTYLHFLNLFNQYDCERHFSDGASRLYVKLLNVANEINKNRPKGAAWIVDFQRSDGYMSAVCGWSKNTLKKHRQELEARQLVSGEFGQAGAKSAGKYHLCYPIANVSNVDTLPAFNVSEVDTIPLANVSNVDTLAPEKAGNVSENVSNVDTLIKEEKKEVVVDAASAAAPTSSSISEKPEPKPKRGAGKPKGATHAEIAGLPLPFAGAEFAAIWRSFYTTNPKQVGKAITAFEMMLKKMGKYPEGFAVVMLEKAIMGSWSGIENEGTARDYQRWLAEEARRPAPAATATTTLIEAPAPNPEFIAQQQAQAEAARNELLARRTATA